MDNSNTNLRAIRLLLLQKLLQHILHIVNNGVTHMMSTFTKSTLQYHIQQAHSLLQLSALEIRPRPLIKPFVALKIISLLSQKYFIILMFSAKYFVMLVQAFQPAPPGLLLLPILIRSLINVFLAIRLIFPPKHVQQIQFVEMGFWN